MDAEHKTTTSKTPKIDGDNKTTTIEGGNKTTSIDSDKPIMFEDETPVIDDDDRDRGLLHGRPFQNLVEIVAFHLLNKKFTIKDDYATINAPVVHIDCFNAYDDQIEAAIETANVYVDAARLECKFLALDEELFVAYVYYNFALSLFNVPFVSQLQTYELCRATSCAFDDAVLKRVAYVHSRFAESPNYNVHINSMVFPWNDRVLPGLHRELARTRREMSAFGCGDTMRFTAPHDRLPVVSTIDSFEREQEIRRIAKLYASLYTTDALRLLETRSRDSPAVRKFLTDTNARAVALNGTACSGKTTALVRLVDAIRRDVDPNAECLKVNSLGGFAGKDCNQVLAMCYQYVSCATGQLMYTSVYDRCMFNNLLWRIILKMMNTRDDMVDVLVRELRDVSPLVLSLMAHEPVIVFVDTDVHENRLRMKARNDGGDSYRCMIENYTPAQNIVYGVFAYLCEWPLFNRSVDSYELIESIVLDKCRSNVARNGGKLPGVSFAKHKLRASGNTDTADAFQMARQIKIFK